MKIGLYGNCQAEGLANCIRKISPSIEVFCFKVRTARISSAEANAIAADELAACDVVFTQPRHAAEMPGLTLADIQQRAKNLVLFPLMNCRTLQPDCGYLFRTDGSFALGPLKVYNSFIVAGAYQKGLPRWRVAKLFNKFTYTSLGYTAQTIENQSLMRDAIEQGYDLEAFFSGQRGRFMHTVNHPAIAILHEIALQAMEKAGAPIENARAVPTDDLAKRPIWPIYPGLATRYETVGEQFIFQETPKKRFNLREFIIESYNAYGAVNGDFTSPELKRVLAFIDEHVVMNSL